MELTLFCFYRSHDGSILAFSSADGYCSAVVFDENELGKINLQKPNTNTTHTTTTLSSSSSNNKMIIEEHDIEMMDIASPPEKRPVSMNATTTTAAPTLLSTMHQQTTHNNHSNNNNNKVNDLNSLIRPTSEKRSMETNNTQPKKRRIAPTFISSSFTPQQ